MEPTTDRTAVPCQSAVPGLRYADARAAIRWLVDVLGAEARQVFEERGVVKHAELWFGAACVMLGTIGEGDTPPSVTGQSAVYFPLSDRSAVDAAHGRACEGQATMIRPLGETSYGSYEFGVSDPEGNYWSFGTYRPR